MHISHVLALATSCAAAVLPREEAHLELSNTLLSGDIPSIPSLGDVDLFARAVIPKVEIVTAEEITARGGFATEAPPGNFTLEARDILGGKDDRVAKLDTGYPWNAMGRLLIRMPTGSSWCSASLVGPRHVLTARNCIVESSTYVFSPAYAGGDRYKTSTVTHIMSLPGRIAGPSPYCDFKDDWAILRLNDELSDKYLGFKPVQDSMSGADLDWWTYGYPQDRDGGRIPYAQNRFKVNKVNYLCNDDENTPLHSDADMQSGQSGSPLWIPESDGRWQYGIMVGFNSELTAFATGPTLVNAIMAARRDWP